MVEFHEGKLRNLRLPSTPSSLLVALDIDGTILEEGHPLSERLVQNVQYLRRAGVHICITTGRSVPATVPIVQQLGLGNTWIVSANGSLIGHYSTETGYVLTDQYTFPVHEVLARVLHAMPEALIGVEDSPAGFRVLRPFPPGELRETIAVQSLEELGAKPVSRVVVRNPLMNNEEFATAVAKINLSDVQSAIGWRAWLDINPPGTSKAKGLQSVCKNLGVDSRHTLAIGDGANDIPLLQFAAYGVAMGNADPAVKRAADSTTLTVEDDGAAAVLEAICAILTGETIFESPSVTESTRISRATRSLKTQEASHNSPVTYRIETTD